MTNQQSLLSKQALAQFSALVNRLSSLPEEYRHSFSAELEHLYANLTSLQTLLEESPPSLPLAVEHDRLKALVESMTDEVWYCETNGNVTMMNDRIVQNLGLDSVDDLNTNIHEIVTQKLEIYRADGTPRPEEEAPQIRSLRGETVHGQELIRHLRTGELRFREYASAPIRAANGEVIGAVGLARDLTDLHEMELRAREYTAQMEVQRRLMEHRELERQELARNLHDGPIQSLGALGFALQIARDATTDQEVKTMLEQMSSDVKRLMAELRGVCNELRPPLLSRFGLKQSIEAHAEEFQQKHPEITIRVHSSDASQTLPERVTITLYRIYQEALTNILRHSGASEVLVSILFSPKHLIFEIRDNGRGFEVPRDWIGLAREGHLGLVGMKERAEAVDGDFRIFSQPGDGATIQVMIPLKSLESAPASPQAG